MCLSKKQGGLGIRSVRTFNLSLLAKLLWRCKQSSELWASIIKDKYCNNEDPYLIDNNTNQSSLVWRSMKAGRPSL